MTVLMSLGIVAMPASAAGEGAGCGNNFQFIGLRAWYAGLTEEQNGKCEIKSPKDEKELTTFVVKIIANVVADLMFIVGILALGFIIYGGFLYIASEGDPGRVARGKSTIVRAVIGTTIAMLANVLVNLFVSVLV